MTKRKVGVRKILLNIANFLYISLVFLIALFFICAILFALAYGFFIMVDGLPYIFYH